MPPEPISFEDWFQELQDLNPDREFIYPDDMEKEQNND